MKVIVKVIIGAIVLYFLGIAAFLFEDDYRKLIRYWYQTLSQNKISFHQPAKYFHLASGEFIVAFCLFCALLYFFLKDKTNKAKILHVILSLFIFATTVIGICFLDAFGKLAECTACQDGTRILSYNEVDYDLIFVLGLIVALVPIVISAVKNRRGFSAK